MKRNERSRWSGIRIETAKANGLDPYTYLRYVFTELPKADTVEAIEALLPFNVDKGCLALPGPP